MEAQAIIGIKCFACHGVGSSDGDFESQTEETYLTTMTLENNPLVVAGNADGSELFYRLKGIFENGDMPRGARRPALTPEEAEVLRTWINQIGQK